MLRFSVLLVTLGIATGSHAATLSNSFPVGTTVELSGLLSSTSGMINAISPSDSAFTSAGISSIAVDGRASGNSEFYNPGSTFGAGPALFNTEAGELILLQEGTSGIDFGSPEITITFSSLVDGFGFRLADTSDGFVEPKIEAFRGSTKIFDGLFSGSYTAATAFGLTDVLGFDKIVISTSDTDGYGITDLTVGSSVSATAVPLPAAGWMLLAGLGGLAAFRRRKQS